MSKVTVSFALLLQDDYSGSDILGGAHHFMIDGQTRRPLAKPEGYYVFTNQRLPCTVRIESALYSPLELRVHQNFLDPVQPLLTLRLLRRSDIFFSGCERVEGILRPGVRVHAYAQSAALRLRAAKDDTVSFLGYTTRQLCRLRFAIGPRGKRESFVITDKLEDNSYRVDEPLRQKHKEGDAVLRAYSAMCDERGRFAIPVDPEAAEEISEVEYYNEEVGKWECLSVTAPS